ncbi:hypothetical protein U9M48_032004 [Paspalum notatum var. saurae]|uniref:Reverse transcriptase domain-containing protein n=1 Tax=Paspalum notatum var. saurae TaxID=547442 RepID=A0AAQ3U6Y8_PASNO
MVAQKVIQPSQTAYFPGRYILEGVTILHKTIQEVHKKKLNGVIFKVDFEKAYDNGSVANDVGRYFQTNKGLRQGDPLSPILFNLVVDMLAIFITRAKENGQVQGLVPRLVDGGLSILQYADDTILFMEHNLEQAKNMKIILRAFEKLSGLKINFHKGELFCYGEAKDFVEHYSQIFGCGVGNLPFRYLGIPMNHKRLSNKDWEQVEERDSHKKKYRLARWKILCMPKEQGGFVIRNLEIQNICLLSKWFYKLINEEGVWPNILKTKYLRGKAIGEVQWKPGDSHFWSSLTKVKEHFLELSSFSLHDGSQIRFWEIGGSVTFRLKINTHLCIILLGRNISQRALVGDRLQKWEELVSEIALVQLDDQPHSFKWNLSKHGCFTVNSMYRHLVNQTALPLNKFLSKLKLPLKIKIFVWFLFKGG